MLGPWFCTEMFICRPSSSYLNAFNRNNDLIELCNKIDILIEYSNLTYSLNYG